MRMVNDLVVRGEPVAIDQLTVLLRSVEGVAGWTREPKTEESLQQWGIGRHGVYCFSRNGIGEIPPVSFYLCKTAANQLSSSSVIPTRRQPLTDEQHNQVVDEFRTQVLLPTSKGLGIDVETIPPRLSRLEWSLSPASLRRLNYFVSMNLDRTVLTSEDQVNWREFGFQVYSDGSMLETQDLRPWLIDQGWSESDAGGLIDIMDVEQFLEHHGLSRGL